MSLSKRTAACSVPNSRELTAEELTQVGGAYSGASDTGNDYHEGSWDYSGYYHADYLNDTYEFFESFSFDDYTFMNDPSIEITADGAMQVVTHTGEQWTQDQKYEYDMVFNSVFNDCMAGTSTFEAIAMGVGGSVAEGYLDVHVAAAGEQLSPTFLAIVDAVKNFNERSDDLGTMYTYCYGNALSNIP